MRVLRAILLTVAWVIPMAYAVIPAYWFMVHPFAARWRRVRRPFLYIVPMWLLTYLLLGFLTFPYSRTQLYDNWPARIAGALLVLGAMATYRAVRRDKRFTGGQLVGRSEIEQAQEQRLVTEGMHARMRHPIYLAALLMVTGWTVGSGLLADYLLLAWALLAFPVMIALEERELVARFGDAYRDYQKRVPAIIPRVG